MLQDKALILMEENPDTPFDMLSKVTPGRISEEGLSHLAQRDIAHWIINRKKPVQRDSAMRVEDWMDRPRQAGPSRFQQEFLKQQAQDQEQAQHMEALQRAFSKLKLSE